ncbi:hypothetical protein EGW08_018640 [Elysia chlorotica]|uniref:Uncharacterized protein n=1 Tax=Elysia chlorotica TaxID=188477 RepID=A0A433SWD1_ELYCH|nr:hypothetical protein EGW08_018640 [Elysia chlorotica]
MNASREPLPPVNNALLPDIYNKLDAGTIQKTRQANTVLDMRLSVQQKLIAKYRQEAKRMLQSQKVSAFADLSRIAQKLPSKLDEPNLDSVKISKRLSQRGYMTGKNVEIVCHRCYIHHLPTKRRFYVAEAKTSPPNMFGISDNHSPLLEKTEPNSDVGKNVSSTQPTDRWEARANTFQRSPQANHHSQIHCSPDHQIKGKPEQGDIQIRSFRSNLNMRKENS